MQESFKIFQSSFWGGARKKERENGVIFFFSFASAPSFPLSLTFLSPFLSVSSRLNHHSLSFHSIPHSVPPHHHHHHLPPRSYFDSFPPFQPLSLSLFLSYSLHFLLLLSIKLWQPTKTKRITTQGIGI